MARIVALVAVVALAATPAAALAVVQEPIPVAPQEQSLLPDPALQQPPVQQAPAPAAEEDDGFTSAGQLLLVALGIAALIGGIWFVIARDARRVTAGRVPSDEGARSGSGTTRAHRTRKLSAAEKRRRKRGRAR